MSGAICRNISKEIPKKCQGKSWDINKGIPMEVFFFSFQRKIHRIIFRGNVEERSGKIHGGISGEVSSGFLPVFNLRIPQHIASYFKNFSWESLNLFL